MRDQFPPVSINFSSVNITGWPGFALVVLVAAIAMEFPETRWLLLLGIAAGALLAAVLIVIRDRRAQARSVRTPPSRSSFSRP